MSSKIEQWIEAQEKMRYWKELELRLRKEICGEIFEGHTIVNDQEKTVKLVLDGYPVKAVYKVNTKIDKVAFAEVWPLLDELEKECFHFNPVLEKGKLEFIAADSMVYDIISTEPATPTLTLEKK